MVVNDGDDDNDDNDVVAMAWNRTETKLSNEWMNEC
jgi:hypothetical protein